MITVSTVTEAALKSDSATKFATSNFFVKRTCLCKWLNYSLIFGFWFVAELLNFLNLANKQTMSHFKADTFALKKLIN